MEAEEQAFLVSALGWLRLCTPSLCRRPLGSLANLLRRRRIAIKYIRLHLQAFTCLQRLTILPATPVLPGPLFFVPFSGQSPIFRPPPLPASPSLGAVALWAAQAVLGVLPMALFYCYTEFRDTLLHQLDYVIYDTLRVSWNPPVKRPISEYDPLTGEWRLAGLPVVEILGSAPVIPQPPQPAQTQAETQTQVPAPPPRSEPPTIPPPPAENQRPFTDVVDSDAGRRNAMDGQDERDEATRAHDRLSATPTPGSPTNAPRRRNTVSSGGADGGGYNSDEEDFELSATLISFDVEAGSAGDTPPNAWSAELRQTAAVSIGFENPNEGYYEAGGDGGDDDLGPGEDDNGSSLLRRSVPGSYIGGVYFPIINAPFYSDTMLARLPATIFAAGAASVGSSLLLADCETATVRLLARAWRMQQGRGVDDLYGYGSMPFAPGWSLTLNGANHFALVILLETMVQTAGALAALGMAWLFRGSNSKWGFWRLVRERLGHALRRDRDAPSAV